MKKKLIKATLLSLVISMSIMSYGQLDYKATWVANSGGTWKTFTQMYMIGATVNQAGITAGVCYWDEGGRGLGIYNTDGNVTNLEWNNRSAGTNVGMNLNFVYNSGTDYITKRSIKNTAVAIRSVSISGLSVTKKEGDYAFSLKPEQADAFRKALGITGVSANELYVVAAVYQQNKVYVYDKDLNFLKTISVERAYYATPDNNGNVWVIQGANRDNEPRIVEFNATGEPTGKVITGFSDPRSLQISKKGQLIVGDNGTNQQVFFYDITGAPALVETFGQKGGIGAGIPGQVKPDKFSGIVYAGTDSLDNLHVITDLEGAIIRRFDKDRNMIWQKYGLAFVDMADADPRNENHIYSCEERYLMDYSKENGQEAEYVACTIDPVKYPDDARIHTALDGGVWIKWIDGRKFMFVGEMYSSFIFIYRFNEAIDGEIAIPCGAVMAHTRFGFGPSGEWPPKQPKMGSFIWRDKNGNGKYEEEEYETVPYQIALANVDDNGNVYLAGSLNYFECQGLDAIGNPVYSFKNIVNQDRPAPFTEIKKVVYDSSIDMMYITGNSNTKNNSYNVGPVYAVYPNWSKGNREAKWIKEYDAEYNGIGGRGDYFFLPYAGDQKSWSVDVFSAKDGTKAGNMAPASLGQLGWIDIPWGLNVSQRSNGEYLVFREDDLVAKTVIFRWNPYVNDNEFPTKPTQLQLISRTSNTLKIKYSRSTDATGFLGYNIYTNGIKSNVQAVGDSTYTITGLQPETTYSISVSSVDFAGHESSSDAIDAATLPLDITAPSKPNNLRVTEKTLSSIHLSWNSATDNVGVIGYDVYLNNEKLGFKPTEKTVYTFNGLLPSTSYEVKLVAYDYAGNASEPSSITVTTLADNQAPTTPTLYATTQRSSSEIAINWSASSDNSDVAYYKLYNKGVLLKDSIPAHEYMGIAVQSNWMLCKITGLEPNTTYEFSIKAVDLAGNQSGFSNTLTMKTDGAWSRLLDVEEADMGIGYLFFYGEGNLDLSGFLFGTMMPGYMEWTVDLPADTLYRFVCHYATEETFNYPMQIDVNGEKKATFELKRLPDMTWFNYLDDPNYVIVRLKAGRSVIRLTSYAQWAPNLDLMKIMITSPFIHVTSVQMDMNDITVDVGQTYQLNASILPVDATDKRIIWDSSRKATATVSSNGLVTGVRNGTAVISATSADGLFSAKCNVTVGPTGVEVTKIDDLVKIYPNPANDVFHVKLADIQDKGDVDIRLYNSLSEMVMTVKSNGYEKDGVISFDTSKLTGGVYILQVAIGNKVDSKKVVISK